VSARRSTRERGFALVAVLLVLAVLGIVGAEFSFSMRLEASAVRTYRDSILGMHLAEAAVEQATRELGADFRSVGMHDGVLTLYDANSAAIPLLQREHVALGAGEFSYKITDEEARLDVNNSSNPQVIDRLLLCHGIDKSVRDVINDSIQDWLDANDEHRLNGAESDDTYLKLEVPYRAHNAKMESIRELLQIKGITPELFYGTDNQPGLVDDVTTKSSTQKVNANTMGPRVACALGLGSAQIGLLEQLRTERPLTAADLPQFRGATAGGQTSANSLGVTSQTFRIRAEGTINGRRGARVTAILRKGTAQGAAGQPGTGMAILEWSVDR
jgi:general secretion pathway protein K